MVGDSDIDFMTAKAAGIRDRDGKLRLRSPPRCAGARRTPIFDHYDQLESRLGQLIRR